MTRTGLSPGSGSHLPEPFVSGHPYDAKRFGLIDGGLAASPTTTARAPTA